MDEDHGVGHILLGLHQQFQVRKDVIAVFECDSTRVGETANLGDVMRLRVRSWQINLFFGFFRTHLMTRCLTTLTLSPCNLFSV